MAAHTYDKLALFGNKKGKLLSMTKRSTFLRGTVQSGIMVNVIILILSLTTLRIIVDTSLGTFNIMIISTTRLSLTMLSITTLDIMPYSKMTSNTVNTQCMTFSLASLSITTLI